jgi:hypothetical protein
MSDRAGFSPRVGIHDECAWPVSSCRMASSSISRVRCCRSHKDTYISNIRRSRFLQVIRAHQARRNMSTPNSSPASGLGAFFQELEQMFHDTVPENLQDLPSRIFESLDKLTGEVCEYRKECRGISHADAVVNGNR